MKRKTIAGFSSFSTITLAVAVNRVATVLGSARIDKLCRRGVGTHARAHRLAGTRRREDRHGINARRRKGEFGCGVERIDRGAINDDFKQRGSSE